MKQVVPSIAVLLLILAPAFLQAGAQGGAAVGGVVQDLHGKPQMGALVELVGADTRVIARTFTDDHGRYLLNTLAPGQYRLRASAAFLLPIFSKNLRVAPNVRTVANLTMTALAEVGAWFPAQRRAVEEPVDDWRWALRSTANRPLLRLNDEDAEIASALAEQPTAPHETGMLTVSSEDGGFGRGGIHQVLTLGQTDGNGRAEGVRANLGESVSGEEQPSLIVDAGYRRQTAMGGQMKVMAGLQSQPELETAQGAGLQSMTLASSERFTLGDAVMIDAGTLLSAERLMATRLRAMPYLQVVVSPATGYAVRYRFASDPALQSAEDLDQQVPPEVLSDAEGRPVPRSGSHQELAVSHTVGGDTETVAFYSDTADHVGLQGGGSLHPLALAGLPVIEDAGTETFQVTVHGHTTRGVSLSWTHEFTPALAASFAMDLGSALASTGEPLRLETIDAQLQPRLSSALSASLQGSLAHTGTAFRAGYRWQPTDTLEPVNAFNAPAKQAYLSCRLRQRLWSGRRLQGVSAIVEATNLLEQGYQPMVGPDGETLFLAQVPRTLQAGLSFSF